MSRHTPSSAKNYLFEITNFLATNPDAQGYGYNDVVMHFDRLTKRYSNSSTRVRILTSIKKYYDFLLFSGVRSDHPCRKLYIRRKKSQIQTQELFSMKELQLVLCQPNTQTSLGVRNKVVLSLLVCQGLASDEIIKLTLQDVDLDGGYVSIKGSKMISGRTLNLEASQIRLIDNYICEHRKAISKSDGKSLIVSSRGEAMSIDGIRCIVDPWRSMFPDRVLNPEKIRMSVISYWVNERKLPVESVLDMSGLKWASSVMQYKDIDMDLQKEMIERFHPLG